MRLPAWSQTVGPGAAGDDGKVEAACADQEWKT